MRWSSMQTLLDTNLAKAEVSGKLSLQSKLGDPYVGAAIAKNKCHLSWGLRYLRIVATQRARNNNYAGSLDEE